jgi:hypothetical protein
MRKENSTGRVFQRSYRDRKGGLQKTSTWFLKYQVGGKPVILPTGTQDHEGAVLMLRRKMAQATQPNHWDYALVDQLLDLVIEDYRSKGRHTTYDVEHRVAKHLRPFFGTKKPFEITPTLLNEYIGSRADNAAPATVNKELADLRRAFRLGYRMSHSWLKPFLLSAGCRSAKRGNFAARRPHVGPAQFAASSDV